ncbi:MAG: AMP-binding protein [Lachnospiraceae bacterium]|nr:AMP-binding protein [Lachnospiraceae bacterium]
MEKTIYTLWNRSAGEYASLPAIRWLEKKDIKEISYADLNDKVAGIRRGLAEEGFSGAHIALIGASSVEWMAAYLAVTTGDNTAIPVEIGLPPKDILNLIDRSDTSCVFMEKRFAPLAESMKESCPKVRAVYFLTEEDSETEKNLKHLIEAGKSGKDAKIPSANDIATLVYTSGTTGKSKGVMLTHENLYSNVEAIIYDVEPGKVFLSTLPIHHAFCLCMDWLQGFWMGAVICINDSYMHMVRNMGLFKPDVMLMVPLMLETIYKKLKAADPSIPPAVMGQKVFGGKLKHIFTGGAHLDPFYIDEFEKYGIMVLEGYGMSECSPVITSNRVSEHKAGSIGRPLSNVEIKIENGEILVRGSSVMKGYYEMPEETAATLKDGWLHTGDKGYIDEDGYLFINGRVKNLIILSNGENISPEEIETKLALNDIVEEVIVTGDNNALTARIYPSKELTENMGEDDIRAELQKVLDNYNSDQPTYRRITGLIVRKNPFIKNATRKILRHEVERDEPQLTPQP